EELIETIRSHKIPRRLKKRSRGSPGSEATSGVSAMDRLGRSPSGEDGSDLRIYARAQKLRVRQPLQTTSTDNLYRQPLQTTSTDNLYRQPLLVGNVRGCGRGDGRNPVSSTRSRFSSSCEVGPVALSLVWGFRSANYFGDGSAGSGFAFAFGCFAWRLANTVLNSLNESEPSPSRSSFATVCFAFSGSAIPGLF
ncbi:MAG: hypothetical protein ACJAVK_003292, partial [Akkermansiaceae bacterium]